MSRCRMVYTPDNGVIVITPYDKLFLTIFKGRVPPTERKWVQDQKAWAISPSYVGVTAEIIQKIFSETIDVTAVLQSSRGNTTVVEARTVLYIGRSKTRDGVSLSHGYSDGAWSVVFPEQVLRAWFNNHSADISNETLYGVLGLSQACSQEEIKPAYRRMVLKHHPDVCKDDGANERFLRIQKAYEVLTDQRRREKYDAGLAMSRLTGGSAPSRDDTSNFSIGYAPPVRCGVIEVQGLRSAVGFNVAKILKWEKIREGNKFLVTHWPRGSDTFVKEWIDV